MRDGTYSVLAAGELKLNGKGAVRRINNLSGHYQPTLSESLNYQMLFEDFGLELNNTWLEYYKINTTSSGWVVDAPELIYCKMAGGNK